MFRNIHVAFSASSGNLRSVLAAGAADVQKFEKGIESAGSSAGKFADLAQKAAKVGAIGLAAALTVSATSAISFDRAMRNVNSISGLTESGLKSLGQQTLAMSRDPFINQGAATLAKGLYDIASSGFQGGQGLMVLRAAAEAASAGLTTTAISGKAITAVLNAYGRSALDVSDVSDVLFQTVNLGVVSFEELASQLGDVVGSAAAAKIPIEDVGAAIAAMTLSGVSAAESATALNQVIQAFIKPSEGMEAMLRSLGYESGAAALGSDGLYKVMGRLRQATGGTVTGMQALFPEIRGLKGALALAAAEGENYRKTQEGIADATRRGGATRKALEEQLKGVGVQMEKFKHSAEAAAIAAGTMLLPGILALMRGVQDLAGAALPYLRQGIEAARPLFRNLAELGVNLGEVVKALTAELGPAASALAALAGGAVVGALNGLASALASIAGFAADHADVLKFAVAIYAVHKAAQAAESILRGAGAAMERMMWNMASAENSGRRGSAGVKDFAKGLLGVQAAAVAVGVGLTLASNVMANSAKVAEESYAKFIKGMPTGSFDEQLAAITQLTDEMDRIEQTAKKSNFELFKEILPGGGTNTIRNARDELGLYIKKTDEMRSMNVNTAMNQHAVAKALGITREEAGRYAKVLGVDLTQGSNVSAEAQERVILGVKKMEQQTGMSTKAIQEAVGTDIEALQAFAAAVEDAVEAAATAFAKATNIFSDTGLKTAADQAKDQASAADQMAAANDRVASSWTGVIEAAEKVTDAEAALRDARKGTPADAEKIRDAEDRLASAREAAAKAGATPAEIRAVANAERDLARARSDEAADPEKIADATRALARARRDLTKATEDDKKAAEEAAKAQHELFIASNFDNAAQLETSFRDRLAEAASFSAGIDELIKRNLDPKLIQNLLEQGPKDAAPTIQALLSDHSGTLIKLANDTQEEINSISEKVILFARVTAAGINAETETIAKMAPLALKITAEQMKHIAPLGVQELAKILEVPEADVITAAQHYGLTVGQSISAGIVHGLRAPGVAALGGLDQNALSPYVGGMADGGILRFADGGVNAHITTRPRVLYGEPETGGEAYIPLGVQKRSRSIKLWEETGRILGVLAMDDGGVRAMADGVVVPGRGAGPRGGSLAGLVPQINVINQQPAAPAAVQPLTVVNSNINVEAPLDDSIQQQIELAARVAAWQMSPLGRR